MKKTAIVMQGASGSGKSTYLKDNWPDATVYSADYYFIENGVYRFDPMNLSAAHKECMRGWLGALSEDFEVIACDNTNSTLWELAPYVQSAVAFDYRVIVVRCVVPARIAARRNIHGVPSEVVNAVTRRLEIPLPYWACEFMEVCTK